MKQGRASRDVREGGKREPIPHAINPGGVGQFGSAVDPKAVEPYGKGRGYRAPMHNQVNHRSGSQGRHED